MMKGVKDNYVDQDFITLIMISFFLFAPYGAYLLKLCVLCTQEKCCIQ